MINVFSVFSFFQPLFKTCWEN